MSTERRISAPRAAAVLAVTLLFACLLAFVSLAAAETGPAQPTVIPLPEKMELREGAFTLGPETSIVVTGDARQVGEYLAWLLRRATVFEFPVRAAAPDGNPANCIVLRADSGKRHLGAEGYELTVHPDRMVIEAATDAGAFYGVQTLRQILPAAVESEFPAVNVDWTAPCLHIVDRPRYSWRGIMLNPGFNFLTKEFIKRHLDTMACYKLNRLHLHLADAGWAIEIKKHPKLTDLANRRPVTERWRNTYGKCTHGFYTQDDMREIIAYAAERHIVIIPEIEMPGHATGALTSYPELACPTWPETIENPRTYGSYPCVFCAGNEKAFAFLEDVLTEVIDLFPSPWIHIGGDEVGKGHWNRCPLCQARMKDEGLKDADELQSYFIKRIAAFVNGKGRRVIGWTEIIEGGLAPGATVQSWLHPDHKKYTEAAAVAANAGHDVIMSTHNHCYLNYVGLSLEKCYAFEPTPPALSPEAAKHILGVEPCLWGFPQHRTDELVFPRLCAFAEVGWSAKEARDFEGFKARLEPHGRRLDEIGINYRRDPAVW
ncbi:MAG: beta-N-acetylhexosaminidase [Thermoguttaceae bacterium]|jgi:hexosaminidase|nr:beta-N-acetylhexosaminidase [Thermoguttaceae bacterium]